MNAHPRAIAMTKSHYEALLHALAFAGFVYGPLGDMVDEKYKRRSDALDDAITHLLAYAHEFGMAGVVDEFEGKKHLTEAYDSRIFDDVREYDEYAYWEELAKSMAERDFHRKYSEQDISAMDEKKFFEKHWDIEEQWNKEFEENGIDRLELIREWPYKLPPVDAHA